MSGSSVTGRTCGVKGDVRSFSRLRRVVLRVAQGNLARWICRLCTLTFVALAFPANATGGPTEGSFVLDNDTKASIIVSAESDYYVNKIHAFAAKELARHLELIQGSVVPVHDSSEATAAERLFYVGIPPEAGSGDSLEPEEARYRITENAVYLYGRDVLKWTKRKSALGLLKRDENQAGTLSAVYMFLENELGVRWVYPGDSGVVYQERDVITLPPKTCRWVPKLAQRRLRVESVWIHSRTGKKLHPEQHAPAALRQQDDIDNLMDEQVTWSRRVRLGESIQLPFGHAFTQWWEKYGAEHPEWFAKGPDGGRGVNREDRTVPPHAVHLCVSNPDVPRQVVREWLAAREAGKAGDYINACPNDGRSFCTCDECMALDGVSYDAFDSYNEFRDAPKSDRYVYFYNSIVREARRHVADARVCTYAYSSYRYPPEERKLHPGIILSVVSDDVAYFRGWREAGARQFFVRPNVMHGQVRTVIMPITARTIYDDFQSTFDFGVIGFNYDAFTGRWPLQALTYYTFSRAHLAPDRPFEDVAAEYYAAFGAAADDVRRFYAFWMKRTYESRAAVQQDFSDFSGGTYQRKRAWCRNIADYYNATDFEKSEAFLQRGLEKELKPRQRKRLRQLLLANRNQHLLFDAIDLANRYKQGDVAAEESKQATRDLMTFRKEHEEELTHICWPLVFWQEVKRNSDPALMKKWCPEEF